MCAERQQICCVIEAVHHILLYVVMLKEVPDVAQSAPVPCTAAVQKFVKYVLQICHANMSCMYFTMVYMCTMMQEYKRG